jgi:ferredoxin-NADP reductase/Na+-transporting NADH:ubiquinone oxidoreductase subunit NqrB
MNYIDRFLDRITMYRLLLYYYLIPLVGVAMVLGAVGIISYSPMAIVAGAGYLTLVCWAINKLFARVWEVPANPESPLITALILALIITPPTKLSDAIFLTMVALLAVASKYLLAIRRKHLFNPAAVAVVLTALVGGQSASWWIGSTAMAPYVIVGGLLLVRKIRRGQMVTAFMAAALATTAIIGLSHGGNGLTAMVNLVTRSSLLFFAFVMLTEPLTSPTTAIKRRWFAVLTGVLFAPQFHIGSVYFAPELALIIGNAFSFLISPVTNILPRLKQQVTLSSSTKDFIFTAPQHLNYRPGQYTEWTLPHAKPDERGSRRYFTLASSPTEDTLRLGVRFYPNGSTYKQAMLAMDNNTPVAAGAVGGDFVLPHDASRKLAFIAGGIGVTPFRSMIKYLHDTNEARDITLLYSERNAAEIAYDDVFAAARQQIGLKAIYVLTDQGTAIPAGMQSGPITAALISAEIPDYLDRLFYISGPHAMVTAMKQQLRGLGVKDYNIKVDFFPGYT